MAIHDLRYRYESTCARWKIEVGGHHMHSALGVEIMFRADAECRTHKFPNPQYVQNT